MKKVYKKLNIIGGILMVMLVFLCSFNIAYAYFTARATVEGSFTFADLDLSFCYTTTDSNVAVSTNKKQFQIYPDAENLLRGNEFGFKLSDGKALKNVGLTSTANDCRAYVRVKVVAVKMTLSGSSYVADTSDTTDYGKYIQLSKASTDVIQNTANSSDNWYYVKSVLRSGYTVPIATGATISTDAPADLTNSYLKITLVFEAVQENANAVSGIWGAEIATLLGLTT